MKTTESRLPTFTSGGVVTAHRSVGDKIRRAILSGDLPGGTRLVQAELAQSLSVSVTPVREALRDLIAEGLVEFDPFRGATVHRRSAEELEEIYELRALLVPVAVRAAVQHITPDELAEAERLARLMVRTDDPAEWIDLNRQFHSVLDVASRRPRLQEILNRLVDLSALYVGLSVSSVADRRERGNDDHLKMIEAYRAGDADEAVRLTIKHYEETAEIARATMQRLEEQGAVADLAP